MNRFAVAVLIAGGALSPLAIASPVQSQDRPVVKMQTLNVRDILYVLSGGRHTLAVMRDEGVLLVDTTPPGWGRFILESIQAVSDRPVTTIINTHAHADHTGGNLEFAGATEIVAHTNAKAAMEKMDAFRGANVKF